MLLQFCDQCGRPLSEGAIARGEAVERNGETVCAQCMARVPVRVPKAVEAGPLGDYTSAVWHCESCGIPVNALDLIEGRATRVGGALQCSRCGAPRATKPAASPSAQRPSLPRAAPVPAARSQPARQPNVRADEFLAGARREQRRPVLPILLFVIVLPMFAVSLWFAITSQQRLNEVQALRSNEQALRDAVPSDQPRRGEQPRSNQPRQQPTNEPVQAPPDSQPRAPIVREDLPPVPLPEALARDLVNIEADLAKPVILKLQSEKLGEVWEGLIEAGARRLIAARPYVRALLADQHDTTRLLACRVCGMLEDKEALVQLSRLAEQDPDAAVATEARKARDRITGQSTREVRDMTPDEIRKLINELREELARRGESND